MLTILAKKHKKIYKKLPSYFFSPVKLQLMGDYIEHTGGQHIDCMLNVGVHATTTKSDKQRIKFVDFNNKDHIVEVGYTSLITSSAMTLTNLFSIVINEFLIRDYRLYVGVDAVFSTSISEFAGINLDTAYISLLVKILNDFNMLNLEEEELISICNKAYNTYNGFFHVPLKKELNMFNSKPNTAMIINPEDNTFDYSKVNFEDFSIVIIYDKEIKEEVDYLIKERQNDSISAHMIVDSKFKHKYLCEFTLSELNDCKDEVRDFEFKRIRHAITENNRVKELYTALDIDDIVKVGTLFTLSQNSLLQDYEITNKRQDTMCNLVSRYNSLGAKMIASKYNNSVFILVKDLQIPNLMKQVSKEYKEQFGSELEFVISNIYK